MIDFGILERGQQASPMNALAQGWQTGRAMRQQMETDRALNAFAANPSDPGTVNALMQYNPELGLKLGDYQRQQETRNALAQVFEQPAAPVAQSPAAPRAPGSLVDPSRLPPRTDGLRLNQDALRRLYALEPETAMKFQKMVFDAGEAEFDAMRERGEIVASAAYRLKAVPVEQRAAELDALAPMLGRLGVTLDMLDADDLSDAGLDRFMTIGQSLKDVLEADRADRRLSGYLGNLEADNARADRNTDSLIEDRGARRGLVERGQNLADARGRRGQDMGSADRRRSQDMTDARGRRAQDMTDKRVRESAGFRGRGRGRGGPAPVTVSTPDQARQLAPGTLFQTPDGQLKVR